MNKAEFKAKIREVLIERRHYIDPWYPDGSEYYYGWNASLEEVEDDLMDLVDMMEWHRVTWGLCKWKSDDPRVRKDQPCLCLNNVDHDVCRCIFCGSECDARS